LEGTEGERGVEGYWEIGMEESIWRVQRGIGEYRVLGRSEGKKAFGGYRGGEGSTGYWGDLSGRMYLVGTEGRVE